MASATLATVLVIAGPQRMFKFAPGQRGRLVQGVPVRGVDVHHVGVLDHHLAGLQVHRRRCRRAQPGHHQLHLLGDLLRSRRVEDLAGLGQLHQAIGTPKDVAPALGRPVLDALVRLHIGKDQNREDQRAPGAIQALLEETVEAHAASHNCLSGVVLRSGPAGCFLSVTPFLAHNIKLIKK